MAVYSDEGRVSVYSLDLVKNDLSEPHIEETRYILDLALKGGCIHPDRNDFVMMTLLRLMVSGMRTWAALSLVFRIISHLKTKAIRSLGSGNYLANKP